MEQKSTDNNIYLKYFMVLSGILLLLLIAIVSYVLISKKDSKEKPRKDPKKEPTKDPKKEPKKLKVTKPHRAVCVIAPDEYDDSANVICIPTKTNANKKEVHPLTGELITEMNSYRNLKECNRKVAAGRSMCTEVNYLDPHYYRYWGNYYLPYVNGNICTTCTPMCDGSCGNVNIYINSEGEEVAEPAPEEPAVAEPAPEEPVVEEPVLKNPLLRNQFLKLQELK